MRETNRRMPHPSRDASFSFIGSADPLKSSHPARPDQAVIGEKEIGRNYGGDVRKVGYE
jgi:hypothetical protein